MNSPKVATDTANPPVKLRTFYALYWERTNTKDDENPQAELIYAASLEDAHTQATNYMITYQGVRACFYKVIECKEPTI